MEENEKKYNYIYEILMIISILLLFILGIRTYFDGQNNLIFKKYQNNQILK
jgi:hypothetical protein